MPTFLKRYTIVILAALLLLAGCHRFRRPCSSSTPTPKDRSTNERDWDSRGVISPREFEPIPSTNIPTTPRSGAAEREPTRTDTFSLERAAPKLGWSEPSLPDPLLNVESSPTELPTATEPRESKKFWVTPDGAKEPDAKKPADGRPSPERGIFLEPVAPKPTTTPAEESSSSLPTINADTIQRSANKPTISEDRAGTGLKRLTTVRGVVDVANGDRPTLEGLDSLKKAGYSTVIYIHHPKADVGPAQKLCEQRAMKLVPIPITSDDLPLAFASFSKALQNMDRGRTYVCDEADGLHTGVLWYGYFRRVGLLSADTSMLRAQSLGLPARNEIPSEWKNALISEFDTK